jgi:hypothetical protein
MKKMPALLGGLPLDNTPKSFAPTLRLPLLEMREPAPAEFGEVEQKFC